MSDDDVNFNATSTPNNHTHVPSSPSSPPTDSKSSPSSSPSTHHPPPSTTRNPPVFPAREDCWTEAATHTLIEAWGAHYVELNRGNLRQKHWQEVADAVNALHAHTKKQYRTDIQCKNRIDTLKKRYKIEKSQTLQSNGRYVSTWPFFNSLDNLIGDAFLKNNLSVSPSPSPAVVTPSPAMTPYRKTSPATVAIPPRQTPPSLLPPPSAVPVGPRSKRPISEEALSRRNFSAMAAAAARAAEEEEEEDEESEMSGPAAGAGAGGGSGRKEAAAMSDGYRKLAEAIGRFAEIYERVEEAKQRQLVELEKQRMQFAKDLEIQRMKLFMESQVQLEKIKRTKRSSANGGYS